jgi:hypothetical protein
MSRPTRRRHDIDPCPSRTTDQAVGQPRRIRSVNRRRSGKRACSGCVLRRQRQAAMHTRCTSASAVPATRHEPELQPASRPSGIHSPNRRFLRQSHFLLFHHDVQVCPDLRPTRAAIGCRPRPSGRRMVVHRQLQQYGWGAHLHRLQPWRPLGPPCLQKRFPLWVKPTPSRASAET